MIRVLAEEIANRIAAGEVVERPASVVKELVENALDAGARHVRVEVEDGGRKLIRVIDDGCGMDSGDLARCLLPHATSKIEAVEDLQRIGTFGFRGEALASIASVSRMQITSRQKGSILGSRIVSDGGAHGPVEPAGAPLGTAVEVHNLFFNVPARRNFLKQGRFELAQIVEVLTRLALPDPDWGLEIVSEGKPVLVAESGGGERMRLASLFGTDIAERLLPIQGARGSTRLSGFVSPVDCVRPSAKYQQILVNGRPIRDRRLSYALAEAYRGLIMPRDFPVAFLFLDVDPAMVDVNVHPAKTEVRFRDPDTLFGLILRTVRERLTGDAGRNSPAEAHATSGSPGAGAGAGTADLAFDSAAQALAQVADAARPQPPVRGGGDGAGRKGSAEAWAEPRFIQVHRSYVVVESDDGIRIVDQHALHERKLFDELLARFASSSGEDQLLLVPHAEDVDAADRDDLLGHVPGLARLGLAIEAFGPRGIVLRSVPMALRNVAPDRVLFSVIETLRERGAVGQRDVIEDVVAHLACRAAVKFNDALPEAEVRALLRYEALHPQARNCPHGRNTSLTLTLRELENRFQRKK